MNKKKCALKLVDEIILYYDARSKKHQSRMRLLEEMVTSNNRQGKSTKNAAESEKRRRIRENQCYTRSVYHHPQTGHPEWVFSWFFSITSPKCRDIISNSLKIASSRILANISGAIA